jgi:hypothetical protein
MFDTHCRSVDQGRVTGEKALQSFVTDEISLPLGNGKIVCDIVALRRDGGRSTPVLIELKDTRQLTRLVEQVDGYAALIDLHASAARPNPARTLANRDFA